MIPVISFAIIASALFSIGIYGLASSRNIVRILLSSEVILNSAILFVFSLGYYLGIYNAFLIALFGISMALAEVVVAFSILFLVFRKYGRIDEEKLTKGAEKQ
jgi:NADH-quinone oxidoreductase subunit K